MSADAPQRGVPTDIFFSVGHAQTPEQQRFVAAVHALLVSHGLNPRTVGRTDFSSRKPLKRILEVLRECSGTMVVALERVRILSGLELQAQPGVFPLADVRLPTVCNQVEAAMAYSLGQPLLAIVETGLRSEGLLEERYDWYVKWLDLDPDSLGDPGFLETFSEWKRRVEQYRAK